jgi:hypothetical protein
LARLQALISSDEIVETPLRNDRSLANGGTLGYVTRPCQTCGFLSSSWPCRWFWQLDLSLAAVATTSDKCRPYLARHISVPFTQRRYSERKAPFLDIASALAVAI